MEQEENLIQLLESDKAFKNWQWLNLFWLGFIIYTLGYTLSVIPNAIYIISDLMRILGIGLFIVSFCLTLSFRLENRYFSLMLSLLMIWAVLVVVRGIDPNYEEIKNSLFNPLNGLFLYLTPLVALLPKNPNALKLLFKIIIVLGIAYLVQIALSSSLILDWENVDGRDLFEVFVKVLGLPCGFILMTYNYHGSNQKLLALAVILLTILFAAIRVRRGLLFITGTVLVLAFLIFLYVNKRKSALVICSIFAGFLIMVLGLGAFGNSNMDIVNRIKERLEEDTRDGVELYFYADMEPKDWLVGRGMNGLVAAPPGIDESGDYSGYRNGIETDYLNIILKGGSISLGLLLLIAIPAMFKGLMFSNNSLSKAAGFWILIWLLSLYPSTVTTFSMNYILVWISIGICYSPSYRSLSEETLRAYFKGNFESIADEEKEKT